MEAEIPQTLEQLKETRSQIDRMINQLKRLEGSNRSLETSDSQTQDVKDKDKTKRAKGSTPADKSGSDTDTDDTEVDVVADADAETEGAIPEGGLGWFDGEFVVIDDRKYQVPPNYASKSKLVFGDKLELVEHGAHNLFKIVERVDRIEVTGILTKDNHEWVAKYNDHQFKVIPAAVRHYEGEIGDRVRLILPADFDPENPPAWAAVAEVLNSKEREGSEADDARTEEKINMAGETRPKGVKPASASVLEEADPVQMDVSEKGQERPVKPEEESEKQFGDEVPSLR